MTGREYMDEVKLRLLRNDVAQRVSDPLLLTYINMARRQVQRSSVQLYPEYYGNYGEFLIRQFTLRPDDASPDTYFDKTIINSGIVQPGRTINAWSVSLPDSLIEVHEAILCWRGMLSNEYGYEGYSGENGQFTHNFRGIDGIIYDADKLCRTEIRRAHRQEFYELQKHAFNVPHLWSPVFMLERFDRQLPTIGQSVIGMGYNMILSGLDMVIKYDPNLPDIMVNIFDLDPNPYVEVYYTSAVDNLDPYIDGNLMDAEITVPIEYEEMIINYALMYVYEYIDEVKAVQTILATIKAMEAQMESQYAVKRKRMNVLIPSKNSNY